MSEDNNKNVEDWSEEDRIRVSIENPDFFRRVQETLTRIGVVNVKEHKLWQSCHVVEENGAYFVVHFKEVFMMEGKDSDFSIEDEERRNCIIDMLQTWNLLEVIDPIPFDEINRPRVFVLKYALKSDWQLFQKVKV